MFGRFFYLALLLVLPSYSATVSAEQQAEFDRVPPLEHRLHHPNASRDGMVVAEERLAAEIGARILDQGGNAVDAAVATAFALAVTFPRAGNIGGGGFMLVHLDEENTTIAIDYRETAPLAAHKNMFLDEQGNVIERASTHSRLAAGVPGTVAGLLHALEEYGTMSRWEVMSPAIRLAQEGYSATYFSTAMLEANREFLSEDAAARLEFFGPSGKGFQPGDPVQRPDLARTLMLIAWFGRDGFYKGIIADAIAEDIVSKWRIDITRRP